MKINEFYKLLNDFAETIASKKKLPLNENHYTDEILTPYLRYVHKLKVSFDKNNFDGGRPDVKCYLNDREKGDDENCKYIFESKLPVEFGQLSEEEIILKFLDDKIVPYILSAEESVEHFVIHCFTRFLDIEVTDTLLKDLHNYRLRNISKLSLAKSISKNLISFSLTNTNKKLRNIEIQRLHSHFSKILIPKTTATKNTKTFILENSESLKRFCTQLTNSIIDEDCGESFYGLVKSSFNFEMEKKASPVRISYRLFLSTRFPDCTDNTQIEAKDSSEERELFVLSGIYYVISKLFIQKYVEDLFSDDEDSFIMKSDCFIVKKDVNSNLYEHLKLGFANVANSSSEAYKQIIEGNEYFDSLLNKSNLNSKQFNIVYNNIVRLDLRTSIKELSFNDDILGGFFETFSQKFNKEVRKVFGQYYTPKVVVNFIWDRVLQVIKDEKLDVENIKLLDPACGSGTFLVEGLKKLSSVCKTDLSSKVVAFDISPMASSIAEINIFAEALKHANVNSRKRIRKINVYNTDSLSIAESPYWQTRLMEEDDAPRMRMLDNQKRVTSELKKKKEYTLVVTNPPYNGSSSRTLESFSEFTLLETLKENRHSTDRIRDDYVWFMAAIDHYINNNGIVGLITSDSYLYKSSYGILRKYLYDNYRIHEIYQLGENIFDDAKVATSIIIMSKFDDESTLKNKGYDFAFYDLTTLKSDSNRNNDDRYNFLSGKLTVVPSTLRPSASNNFSFIVSQDELFKNCISLFNQKKPESSIIKKKYSGAVSGFKDFFVDSDEDLLHERIEDFFRLSIQSKSSWKGKPHSCTNDEIHELGESLLYDKRFQRFQLDIEQFQSKWGIKAKKKETTLSYLAMLASSILLRDMKFDPEKILPTISLSSDSKKGYKASDSEFIYLDQDFTIPRVNFNGSKNSGGPRTCWGKFHHADDKVFFINQSSPKGFSLVAPIFDGVFNPVLLKASEGGDAHFFRISELEVTKEFAVFGFSKKDLYFYIKAIANSPVINKYEGYILANGVPIPVPFKSNLTIIRRLISLSLTHQELAFIKTMINLNKFDKSLFVSNVSQDTIKLLKLNSITKQQIVSIDLNQLQLLQDKMQRSIDVNLEQLYSLTSKVTKQDSKTEIKASLDVLDTNRLAISSYILNNIKDGKYIGRTKFQKAFFLVDTMLDINLATKYHREAAGPLDYDFIYSENRSIEKISESSGLLQTEKKGKLVIYKNISIDQKSIKIAKDLIGSMEKDVQQVLKLIKDMDTNDAELLATLFAIWNDRLIQKKPISDEHIVADLLTSWHPEKNKKFNLKLKQVQEMLDLMKLKKIIPAGKKNRTLIKKNKNNVPLHLVDV